MKKVKKSIVTCIAVLLMFVCMFAFAGCDLFNKAVIEEQQQGEQTQTDGENEGTGGNQGENQSGNQGEQQGENQSGNQGGQQGENQGENNGSDKDENLKSAIQIQYGIDYDYDYASYQPVAIEDASEVAEQIEIMSDGVVPASQIESYVKTDGNINYVISINLDCITNKEDNKSLNEYVHDFRDAYIAKYSADSSWTCMSSYIDDADSCFFKTISGRDVLVNVDSESNDGLIYVIVICFDEGSISQVMQAMAEQGGNENQQQNVSLPGTWAYSNAVILNDSSLSEGEKTAALDKVQRMYSVMQFYFQSNNTGVVSLSYNNQNVNSNFTWSQNENVITLTPEDPNQNEFVFSFQGDKIVTSYEDEKNEYIANVYYYQKQA